MRISLSSVFTRREANREKDGTFFFLETEKELAGATAKERETDLAIPAAAVVVVVDAAFPFAIDTAVCELLASIELDVVANSLPKPKPIRQRSELLLGSGGAVDRSLVLPVET